MLAKKKKKDNINLFLQMFTNTKHRFPGLGEVFVFFGFFFLFLHVTTYLSNFVFLPCHLENGSPGTAPRVRANPVVVVLSAVSAATAWSMRGIATIYIS